MEDAADFYGVSSSDKEEPVIGDAEPEFIASLKRLHVALARLGEAVQGGKDTHGGRLIEAADIGFGQLGPNNPLHRALLQRSISSWVIPSSAITCSWGMPSLCFSHSRDSSSALISSAESGSSSPGADEPRPRAGRHRADPGAGAPAVFRSRVPSGIVYQPMEAHRWAVPQV